MKNVSILLFFFANAFFCIVNAQVNNILARSTYAEKIYLQTDNQIYTTNSTIWFKAIAVNVATLTGGASSGVLYVDLINEEGEITDNKIIKLSQGLGNGYFDLGSNVESGQYRIRAYTEWNKNFSNDFIFVKAIEIVTDEFKDELSKSKKIQTDLPKVSDKILVSDQIDVQFFPEGGKLIHNTSSKVGFKAVGRNGLGVAIEGEILDNTDQVVARFKSNDLGMGHFVFNTPNATKIYKSRITSVNGVETEIIKALPKIENEGISFRVNDNTDMINIEVTTSSYPNVLLSLKGYSRGITYLDHNLNLADGSDTIALPKTDFPEGIIIFSVYDQQSKVVAERMYFNKNGMASVNVDVNLNKQEFDTREEVIISMKAEAQLKSTSTNHYDTSVLVLDKSRIDMEDSSNANILTYLLLSSDLNGHIESPHLYFEANSTYDIDDLMLTQGWRNYKYENVVNNTFTHQKEMGIPFKGMIKTKRPQNPQKTENFVVMDFGKEPLLSNVSLNIPGNFYFEVDNLTGDYNKILIKPSNISDKEDTDIDIVLSKKPELPIDKPIDRPIITNEIISKSVVEEQNEIMKIEKDYFENLYGPNLLDKVVVYGYTMTPKRREMSEKYGLPNTVIDGKDIRKKAQKTSGLADVLMAFRDKVDVKRRRRATLADPTFLRLGTTRGGKGHVNMVIVDGIPVNQMNHFLVEDIAATEVTSFEIIDDPRRLKQLYAEVYNTVPPPGLLLGSIVSIYTRNGVGLYGALKPNKKQKIFDIQGFSPIREFYIPKYDVEDNYYGDRPDYRPTIYWEPHVKTEDGEKKQIRFYHSDNEGDFIVILETISQNGKIGYSQIDYNVKETNSD